MDYRERVLESFRNQGIMQTFNAEITETGKGICKITMPFDKKFTQQNGFFHGGVVSTLADSASGYAAYTLMEEGSSVLTIEFKVNFIAAADGEKLIAIGKVIKSGKTLSVCHADVFTVKNEITTLCATAQLTMMQLLKRD